MLINETIFSPNNPFVAAIFFNITQNLILNYLRLCRCRMRETVFLKFDLHNQAFKSTFVAQISLGHLWL